MNFVALTIAATGDAPEWLEIFRDVLSTVFNAVVAGASIFGAYLAYRGLNTWREQVRHNSEYEIAKRLIMSALRLRDAIDSFRNPFMTSAELTPEEAKGLDPAPGKNGPSLSDLVWPIRWKRVQEAASNFYVVTLEAEVIWEEKIDSIARRIRECVSELHSSATLYREMTGNDDPDSHRVKIELRDVIMNSQRNKDPNAFTLKVEAAVQSVRDFVKPIMKAVHK
jgi:hypothetical protein